MKINNIWNDSKLTKDFYTLVSVLFVFCAISFADEEVPSKRFEYKLSFRGPHLVLTNGTVPFWQYQGSAIASDESVRITPSLKSKKGAIWSNEINQFENWEVDVTFRISGRGRVGADGLAIWFTTEKNEEGEVFGSKDKWNGLGVFFDSFDNDIKHNNPFIMAMVNDGTKDYDHEADGSNQQLGGCLKDFRNKPYPSRVKIHYYKKSLSVHYNNGLNEDVNNYDLCFKVDNIDLNRHGYFGVSAATGGVADDHDVLAFETHSLSAPTTTEAETELAEEEKLKYAKEYQDYFVKMEKAKEEYKKEHPNIHKGSGQDDDTLYEAYETRELRQIFQGQQAIEELIKLTGSKLNELFARQEKQAITITEINDLLRHQPSQDNSGLQKDLENIMRAQTLFSGDIKELKSHVSEIENNLHSFKSQQITNNDKLAHELHNKVKDEMKELSNHLSIIKTQLSTADKSSPCISMIQVIFLLSCHLFFSIAFHIMKARREAAAKKLF